VHAHGEVADDVLVDALLTLDFGNDGRRAVDVEQREVRLAVLVHAVGEGADAPRLGLGDLAAHLLDHALDLGGQFLDLLGARVLTREKPMLVKRHESPFLKLAQRPAASPSNPSGKVRSKLRRREQGTTGQLALPHQSKGLLGPSVQLPAGRDEWRAYRGFWPI